ncbi:MAG: hypothetical protein QME32_04650 [Endomicrobiia bacterium]|nr:hypothetical protein [Endomicrobiia bacterium]
MRNSIKPSRLSPDDVAAGLSSEGIKVVSRSPLPYGERLDISLGAKRGVVNVYFGKKGTAIVAQGRSADLIKAVEKRFARYAPSFKNGGRSATAGTIKSSPVGRYIGSDESGKGDYFGPLAVAAFLSDERTDEKIIALGARDSKKLSDESAIKIADRIKSAFALRVALIVLDPAEYNRAYALERSKGGNLNTLLARLHAEAIGRLTVGLKKTLPDFAKTICVITDAFSKAPRVRARISESSGVSLQNVRLIERAESYPAVAAASVIARAAYLDGLARLAQGSVVGLPKGAGHEVLAARRVIVERLGEKHLARFAKVSFKMV